MSKAAANIQTVQGTKILIVDDEDMLAWSIETELKALGAEVLRAGTFKDGLERFDSFAPDAVICDLRLPDGNGLELVQSWKAKSPEIPVILITAHGAIDSAISALRLGAFDYLQKPFDIKSLMAATKRAVEVSKLRRKVKSFTASEISNREIQIIGKHPKIKELTHKLKKVAQSNIDTILILGESGSGKELASRAIHFWGKDANKPFVEINCASIPENLLESELFGYEKGAFTDAREKKIGLFELAKGGSIFLDEIGELPLKLQAKLLRALEYKKFKRLGGTKDLELKAKIIAATNCNLLRDVQEGKFRADLFYRLAVIALEVPPLRERLQDMELLCDHIINQICQELEIPKPKLSADLYKKLREHSWPGNVRELKNILKSGLIFMESDTLTGSDIQFHQNLGSKASASNHQDAVPSFPSDAMSGKSLQGATSTSTGMSGASNYETQNGTEFTLPDEGVNLEELEKDLINQALTKARNNQTKAARLLGISRHTLRYRLEKHGLAFN